MTKIKPSDYLISVLEKAKSYPEGTVRNWKGQDYKKKGGKWIKVGKGTAKTSMTVGKKDKTSVDGKTANAIKQAYNEIKGYEKNKGASLDDLAYEVSLQMTKPVSQKKIKGVLKTLTSGSGEVEKTSWKKAIKYLSNRIDEEGYEDLPSLAKELKDKKILSKEQFNYLVDQVENKDKDYFEVLESMSKSIPAMPGVQQQEREIQKPKKTIPMEVKNFIEKVETAFTVIDAVVADLCTQKGLENCSDLLSSYKKFKEDFTYKLNDEINYPTRDDDDSKVSMTEKSDYDQSRVKLGKVKVKK